MTPTRNAILDPKGRVMFTCAACHEPLGADDFFDLGLRLPDDGESQDDYFAAELIDDLRHAACAPSVRAG